jgi:hypothetical protein
MLWAYGNLHRPICSLEQDVKQADTLITTIAFFALLSWLAATRRNKSSDNNHANHSSILQGMTSRANLVSLLRLLAILSLLAGGAGQQACMNVSGHQLCLGVATGCPATVDGITCNSCQTCTVVNAFHPKGVPGFSFDCTNTALSSLQRPCTNYTSIALHAYKVLISQTASTCGISVGSKLCNFCKFCTNNSLPGFELDCTNTAWGGSNQLVKSAQCLTPLTLLKRNHTSTTSGALLAHSKVKCFFLVGAATMASIAGAAVFAA